MITCLFRAAMIYIVQFLYHTCLDRTCRECVEAEIALVLMMGAAPGSGAVARLMRVREYVFSLQESLPVTKLTELAFD